MRISRSTVAGLEVLSAEGLSRLIPSRDYSGLNQADSQLRVWLPEPARLALDEIGKSLDITMTAYLTELFACHLYGYHEVLLMKASKAGLYETPPIRKACAMSVGMPSEPELVPNLGKNIFALKIWIPLKIKSGLQKESNRIGSSLGVFVRAKICSHLFGSDYAPPVLQNQGDACVIKALDWEAGSDDLGN